MYLTSVHTQYVMTTQKLHAPRHTAAITRSIMHILGESRSQCVSIPLSFDRADVLPSEWLSRGHPWLPVQMSLRMCSFHLWRWKSERVPPRSSIWRPIYGRHVPSSVHSISSGISRDDATNGESAHLCWSITRRSRRLQCAPAVPGEGTAHERSASAVWCRVDQSEEKYLRSSPVRWGAALLVYQSTFGEVWIWWKQVDGLLEKWRLLQREVLKGGRYSILCVNTTNKQKGDTVLLPFLLNC